MVYFIKSKWHSQTNSLEVKYIYKKNFLLVYSRIKITIFRKRNWFCITTEFKKWQYIDYKKIKILDKMRLESMSFIA